MVKVADLGYSNDNLQNVPSSDQEKKDEARQRAIANLTAVQPPPRLSLLPLPGSLFGKE